jgi:outer membrane protein TolC
MTKSILFWVIFSTVFSLYSYSQGNDTLYIEYCYQAMITNWPTSKNIALSEQSSDLKTKNIGSSWLPQVSVNGQATYQSDVTNISSTLSSLPIHGLSIPELSKDQYKATLDVNQVIFDGGVTSERKKLENANMLVEKQQIAVDINQRKEQINSLFFNALLMQENEDLLNAFRKRLEEKQSVISSCVTNGILTESDLYSIQAEIIKTDQQIADARISRENILSSLSLLTGQDIPKESKLGYKQITISIADSVSRPEIKLFQLQQSRLDASSGITKKTLMPKLYGFGQAGYGRPGLNMLSNKFESFYIVGAKLNWTIWDWSQSNRDRRVNDIQKEIISNQKDAFVKSVSVQSENELGDIKKMEILLDKDLEIIKLREKITASSSSKLQNGTIKSADYIDDITAETQAKIDMKKHQVQLMLAKYNYLVIKGSY